MQRFEPRALLVVLRNDQLAAARGGDTVARAARIQTRAPLDTGARLPRARLIVEAGVDHPAVARAGLFARAVVALEHDHRAPRARQPRRACEADGPRADDGHVGFELGRLARWAVHGTGPSGQGRHRREDPTRQHRWARHFDDVVPRETQPLDRKCEQAGLIARNTSELEHGSTVVGGFDPRRNDRGANTCSNSFRSRTCRVSAEPAAGDPSSSAELKTTCVRSRPASRTSQMNWAKGPGSARPGARASFRRNRSSESSSGANKESSTPSKANRPQLPRGNAI